MAHHERRSSMFDAILVEQACINLEQAGSQQARMEAEQFLMSLRKSPSPYSICKHVLDKSANGPAQFHAIAAIQEAVLREWADLGANAVALRDELLLFVINRGASLDRFVLSQLLHCVSVMYKRGFYTEPEPLAQCFLDQLRQLLEADDEKKTVGLGLCVAMLSEFASSHSSALGLPLEFHLTCHRAFEVLCLPQIFAAIMPLLQSLAESPARQQNEILVGASAKLLEKILSWEFEENLSNDGILIKAAYATKPDEEKAKELRPGQSWTDVLLRSNFVGMLFTLYTGYRTCGLDIAHLLRECILQLASLQGPVFPQHDPSLPHELATFVYRGVCGVLEQPISNVESDEVTAETVAMCRILGRLVHNFGLAGLFQRPDPRDFLTQLARLTCAVLQPTSPDDATWAADAFSLLGDAWTYLLTTINHNLDGSKTLTPKDVIPRGTELGELGLGELTQQIFQHYMRKKLLEAKDYIPLDVDVEKEEAELEQIAIIGRVGLVESLRGLQQAIADRTNNLQQLIEMKARDCDDLQEEMYVCVTLMGGVLADPRLANGLRPNVPDTVIELTHNQPQVVVEAGSAVFAFVELAARFVNSHYVLGRLMSRLVWFMQRWADSYLMPDESRYYKHKLPEDYCYRRGTQGGREALEFIVTQSCTVLLATAGRSGDTPELVCALLRSLSESEGMCNALRPPASPAWWNLISAFSSGDSSLNRLKPAQLGELVKGLVQVLCTGSEPQGAVAAEEVFGKLMTPVTTHFQNIMSLENLTQALATRPEVSSTLGTCLSIVAGVAKTTGKRSFELCIEFLARCMESVLGVLNAVPESSQVVFQALEAANETAKNKIRFMGEQHTRAFVGTCLDLVKAYERYNARVRDTLKGQDEERVGDVEAAMADELELTLELIANVLVKETMGEAGFAMDFVADAALEGLSLVLPCLSHSILSFPGVCRAYFGLLEVIILLHPDKFANMAVGASQALLETVQFTLGHADSEVVELGLQTIKHIATFHSNFPQSPFGGSLSSFTHKVLNVLLVETFASSLLDPLSDALLPLILADMPGYQRIVNELLSQVDAGLQARVGNDFNQLLQANNVTADLSPENQTIFRSNVRSLVSAVRAVLQCK